MESPISETSNVLAEVLAGFSHEINNPLTAAQGLATLAKDETVDAQCRQDLQTIEHETERAVGMVSNLRGLALILADINGPADLNVVVDRIIKVRSYEMAARGVDLRLQADQSLPPIPLPGAQLAPLLLSLEVLAEKISSEALEEAGSRTEEHPASNVEILFKTSASPRGPWLEMVMRTPIATGTLPEHLSEKSGLQALVHFSGTELEVRDQAQGGTTIRLLFPDATA